MWDSCCSPVLLHVVSAEESGRRTDLLVASLSGASRSRVAQRAKLGEILVNGASAKPSLLLEEGDVLEFEIPPPRTLVAYAEPIELAVLYEDDDLLVVDKPAGMVTHPAHGAPSGTLVNALLAHTKETLPGDMLRPGLVHRLDRDTSGLLVVAKRDATLEALQAAMKARRIAREYLGLVSGIPQNPRGRIDGPIGRDPRNRLKYTITSEGKPAVTHYTVREAFPKAAELVFTLDTGRTHQIRVHLAAAGHPIINDPLYGKREPRFELPGQALHAWRLAFPHPRTGAIVEFEVPPPPGYLQARRLVSL
ncbi:MAG TPA: RluA family pseudouridine synthase [Candidatus Acidoferrales bacterium]|nr:RluA family pseudouridine synthase [Candidatus Acidoferrales bacterium]